MPSYLSLEVGQKSEWHPPMIFSNLRDNTRNKNTDRPAESSAITMYVKPPSEM